MRISDCSSDVCSSDLLVIHSVLTGGQAQGDTMDGLASLLEHFPNVPVVVWLNEFFGRVERDGRKFEDSKLFRDHQEQIHALIRIPELRKEIGRHTSELQSLMRISYAVFCLKKKTKNLPHNNNTSTNKY